MPEFDKLIKQIENETKDIATAIDRLLLPFNKEICSKCKEDCCCRGCNWSSGYLRQDFVGISEKLIEKYIEAICHKYDAHSKADGFYHANKGCILPRFLRSRTCLTHLCGGKGTKYFRNRSKTITVDGKNVEVDQVSLLRNLVYVLVKKRTELVKKYL